MTKAPETAAEAERRKRLAAALRENLKRRKAQARSRREEAQGETEEKAQEKDTPEPPRD